MNRKKVVLYNPKSVFFDMPLALLAIGSALDSKKYRVVLVDGRIDPDAVERVLLESQDALCLGVTVLTGAPLQDALAVTHAAKKACPSLPVVWGGWHPSLFPKLTLAQEGDIDVTVQAQGEQTFRELVAAFDDAQALGGSGYVADLSEVRGICWRGPKGTEIVQNPPRAMVNMDELPSVDYSLIELEPYFEAKGRRQLDYISSAGCLFRCEFCADPFVFGRKWSALSPGRIGAELEGLVKEHRVTDVNFQDETFFTYRDRVVQIAREFKDRGLGISWAATLRADQSSRLSDEDFEQCVESGLRRVLIGVESGSQEMMDWLKKDIKIEQVRESAERCRRHGVAAQFPFIVGFPGESDESVEHSINFASELRAMDPKFATPIFYFKPYPGSAITQRMVDQGFKLPETLDEWSRFDFIGSAGPWVSTQKHRYIERFKVFNRLAWGQQTWYSMPLRQIARWRIKKRFFSLPWEGRLLEWVRPQATLS